MEFWLKLVPFALRKDTAGLRKFRIGYIFAKTFLNDFLLYII